jgi:pimeloyl-ACP methyl ester carboxylesterase
MMTGSHVPAPDQILADLRRRLAQTRWPAHPQGVGWRMGVDVPWLRDLATEWASSFDWPAFAARLNLRDHRSVAISGADQEAIAVHIVVEPASRPEAPVLLITPGWPSSFLEYERVIDRLAHPERFGGNVEDALAVVVADLPGFGLSDQPSRPMGPRAIAHLWRQMMVEQLGHRRFLFHGNDWGTTVGAWLGVDHAVHVAGLHLTMPGVRPSLAPPAPPLGVEEAAWLKRTQKLLTADAGYREMQSTKPTTAALGLSDSPAAMLGWIVEKLHGWSGVGPDDPPPIERDTILAMATVYWMTNSLPTANWIYHAVRNGDDAAFGPNVRCEVATGFSIFDGGFFPPPPQAWLERMHRTVFRRDHTSGGHFPALTQPQALANDILEFARERAYSPR